MAFLAAAPVAMAEDLPVPPVPPERPPHGDLAPVPDVAVAAPVALPSEKPSFDFKLYRAGQFDTNVGFTPGSRYQTSEDRKPIQTPGFSISVPLK